MGSPCGDLEASGGSLSSHRRPGTRGNLGLDSGSPGREEKEHLSQGAHGHQSSQGSLRCIALASTGTRPIGWFGARERLAWRCWAFRGMWGTPRGWRGRSRASPQRCGLSRMLCIYGQCSKGYLQLCGFFSLPEKFQDIFSLPQRFQTLAKLITRVISV